MKYLNLSNSIYQQKGSGLGLTVKDGMLINNRPNSMTGIAQACEMKKMVKRAEKISMYSEAMMQSKMMGGDCKMY
jgi:hypothetical protein